MESILLGRQYTHRYKWIKEKNNSSKKKLKSIFLFFFLVGLVTLPQVTQVPMWLPGKYPWRHLHGGTAVYPSNSSVTPITVVESQIVILIQPGRIVPVHEVIMLVVGARHKFVNFHVIEWRYCGKSTLAPLSIICHINCNSYHPMTQNYGKYSSSKFMMVVEFSTSWYRVLCLRFSYSKPHHHPTHTKLLEKLVLSRWREHLEIIPILAVTKLRYFVVLAIYWVGEKVISVFHNRWPWSRISLVMLIQWSHTIAIFCFFTSEKGKMQRRLSETCVVFMVMSA